jgi:uncharacterized damage-inducible protein DinB
MAGVFEDHFRMFALYNRWANARLYEAAAKLPEDALAQDRGAFFKSVLGTLNHLLVADRVWLGRLEGNSPVGTRLDEVLFTALPALAEARAPEDARLIARVFALQEAQFAEPLAFLSLSGAAMNQNLAHVLAHVFNHQAHHRGQAHDLMCQIGGREAVPVLDLVQYERYVLAGDAP